MTGFRRLIPGLLALLLLMGCGAASTTVIVVRHAEKEAGDDPALTAAGQARAQALVTQVATALDEKALTAVYHTPYNRTRLTAEPAAAAAGLTPIVFPVNGSAEQHATELAEALLADQAGGRVLVVGHSNTVPLVLAALGAEAPPAIDHEEYDGFYVIVIREGETPAFRVGTYGAGG